MTVVVLGASGMLGSMALSWLARDPSLKLRATVRDGALVPDAQRIAPGCEVQVLDAESASPERIAAALEGASHAVNCIGVIKPYIHDDNSAEVQRALRVNGLFPHLLAAAAERTRCRVLQIATDCVYSGAKGGYLEAAPQDALDVYGKSKSVGEVHGPWIHHLRCSIIGPELKAHASLLDWFLGQPKGATVKGFTNHDWNGVTTLHYARLCHGVIRSGLQLPHLQHVVPQGTITKAALLGAFARAYGREDVVVQPFQAATVIDRTLGTSNPTLNEALWRAAGYERPPTIEQMVSELGAYRVAPAGGAR
jgi:dTDP-4-dehydrorhamnose reductase